VTTATIVTDVEWQHAIHWPRPASATVKTIATVTSLKAKRHGRKNQLPIVDTNQIVEERRAKLRELRAQGNAFPNDFRRRHLAADLHRAYGATPNEELEPLKAEATVAGE